VVFLQDNCILNAASLNASRYNGARFNNHHERGANVITFNGASKWYATEKLYVLQTGWSSCYTCWDPDTALWWYPIYGQPVDLWSTYPTSGVYNPHAYFWDNNPGYRMYSHHAGETTDWQIGFIRRDSEYLGYSFNGW
jgi:hypothetical protein